MSDRWTPGPWRAEGPDMFGDYNILQTTDFSAVAAVVCNVRSPQEVKATARLISAAPDMAEALEDCIDALNDLGASVATNMLGRAALEKARAALAKARGQA